MRIKTMIIILITILLTVVIMQNSETIPFSFLFAKFYVSKLIVLLIIAIISFIIGVLVGRPSKPKYIREADEENEQPRSKQNTLSEEDRDYIN